MDFIKMPKIARLSRNCIISEKIDGTNGQICIEPYTDQPLVNGSYVSPDKTMYMRACSRTRFIDPSNDNYGFAKWVQQNNEDLFNLGVGRHYGEWWGKGIQRGYGLDHKRFSLFNTHKWIDNRGLLLGIGNTDCPNCCTVVPVLHMGIFTTDLVEMCMELLEKRGSRAAPEYMKPEGIVVYHEPSGYMFKKTIENDELPKSSI